MPNTRLLGYQLARITGKWGLAQLATRFKSNRKKRKDELCAGHAKLSRRKGKERFKVKKCDCTHIPEV